MKLRNGFPQFPAVFNIQDLEVIDFHNGDLSQGICLINSLLIIVIVTFSQNVQEGVIHLIRDTGNYRTPVQTSTLLLFF